MYAYNSQQSLYPPPIPLTGLKEATNHSYKKISSVNNLNMSLEADSISVAPLMRPQP